MERMSGGATTDDEDDEEEGEEALSSSSSSSSSCRWPDACPSEPALSLTDNAVKTRPVGAWVTLSPTRS